MTRRILLVEDDQHIAEALCGVLEAEGYSVTHALRGEEALPLAAKGKCDLVLTDFKLPGLSGLELVKRLSSSLPHTPIILMTAHGTSETAIEATKSGAYDYLLKPFEIPDLLALLDKALAGSRLAGKPVVFGGEASGPNAIVGNSRAMQDIYKEIGRVAGKPVTVLIRGETGTGKELIARALWQHSERASKPFIAVNCSAIPETLLESELFGHERGAFTGALERRIGRFEQAHGGTLFLDEIGELTPNTQAKLLRVLQERTIQRVGGREDIAVDVRVIAATHRDLETAIVEKEFREDLYYRLNVTVLRLPPLRQRREDIPALIGHFLRRYAEEFGLALPPVAPEALELLSEHPWPGNVRELENVARRLLLEARGLGISADIVRGTLSTARTGLTPTAPASLANLVAGLLEEAGAGKRDDVHAAVVEAAERELLAQAMQLAGGNQAQVARWLGLSRLTVREKLQRYGLYRP